MRTSTTPSAACRASPQSIAKSTALRLLPAAVLLLGLAACGGGGGGNSAPADPLQLVAVFSFDVAGGTSGQHTFVSLGFGVHTPDSQSSGFEPFPVGAFNAQDQGTVIVLQPGPDYYQALAALTDGQNSSIGVLAKAGAWNGMGSGSGASESSPSFQRLDPTLGVPDLAGFAIDAIDVQVLDIAIASTPIATSWSLEGQVRIYGRRL